LGAYDFAELLTKRPFTDMTYHAVFAMRGQLLLLTWYLAFGTQKPRLTLGWWVRLVICGVLIVAQLPPLTFVNELNNPNQQQQALLAWQSLLGVGFGLSGLLWRLRHYLRLSIGLVGIVTTLYGLVNGLQVMQAYQIPAIVGFGGVGLVVIYVGIVLWHGFKLRVD